MALQLGSECVEDKQCNEFLNASICQNNACVCPFGKHEKNGTCMDNAEIGGKCDRTQECITRNSLELSGIIVCEQEICKNLKASICCKIFPNLITILIPITILIINNYTNF